MGLVFKNNAKTTLSSGVNDSTTTIPVTEGSVFPVASATDGTFFFATLDDDTNNEIVKVTASTGNSGNQNLTVVRAQESTSARAFSSGDKVELRLTAGMVDTFNLSGNAITLSSNKMGFGDSSPEVSLDLGSQTDSLHVPVGTTAQRPGSPEAGYLRYNSTTGKFEGYTNAWGDLADGSDFLVTNTYTTANASTTAFTISNAVQDEKQLLVFIDGVFQAHNSYSVSGTTVTLSTAPASGREVTIYSALSNLQGANMVIATMTGDNSDTTLDLGETPVSENNDQVYIDGTYQNKDTYSISGQTLTFSTAPPTGTAVEAITHTVLDISAAASSVLIDEFTGNGSTTAFTLAAAPANENNTQVYVGGVYQEKATYSVSGTTLTLTEAPANDVSVEVMSIAVGQINSAIQLSDADGDTKVMVEESSDEDKIRFDTGGSERMIIDDGGIVGIGTSSPTSYANSQKTLVIEDSASPAIAWSDTGQTRDWFAIAQGSGLYFNYGDGGGSGSASNVTSVLVLDNSGSVGIGTTDTYNAEADNLIIYDSGNAGLTIATGSTSGNNTIHFADGTSGDAQYRGVIEYKHNDDSMRFKTDGEQEKVRIDGNNLFLTGGTDARIQLGSGGAGAAQVSNDTVHIRGDGDDMKLMCANDGQFLFEHNGTERLRLSASGGTYAAMHITSDYGRFDIGALNTGFHHFMAQSGPSTVYFNVACQANGGFSNYSDEKLKEDITTLTGALDSVAKMKGVTFKWKDAANRGGGNAGKQFGVTAQNMLEIDAELPTLEIDPLYNVTDKDGATDEDGNFKYVVDGVKEDDKYYTMDYSRLTPFFIEAIKELKTKLEAAEARIATLEGS